MSASLSDEYVLLLEKVVNENKALREQMQRMADNEKSVLSELHRKIDNLQSSNVNSRRVRQTGTSIHIPKMCRNDVRRKLKLLEKSRENEFVRFSESFASEHNNKIFHTLVDELKHEYGGDDKCPWTLLQLKDAFKTYLKSRKTQEKRKENNLNVSHLKKCRRQARKREKLGKRIKSLENKDWGNERKAKVLEIMTMDFMSSEESEHENQSPHKITNYVVRPLSWQSNELKRYKRRLDKAHHDSLPELIQKRTLPRTIGEPSARRKPASCPDWACTAGSIPTSTPTTPTTPSDRHSRAVFSDNASPSSCSSTHSSSPAS